MSTDNLTIRADVSPNLHPEVLSPHAEALEERPSVLATGQNALATATATSARSTTLRRRCRRPSRPESAASIRPARAICWAICG